MLREQTYISSIRTYIFLSFCNMEIPDLQLVESRDGTLTVPNLINQKDNRTCHSIEELMD